jgi:hypothetical protein
MISGWRWRSGSGHGPADIVVGISLVWENKAHFGWKMDPLVLRNPFDHAQKAVNIARERAQRWLGFA